MKNYVVVLLFFGLTSCQKTDRYVICNDRYDQCITIHAEYLKEVRYISVGDNYAIPNTNYVKYSSERIDRLLEFVEGCWHEDGWKIAVYRAEVLENKLAPIYQFETTLQEDEYGVPNSNEYDGPGCFNFSFEYEKVYGVDESYLK